MQDERKSPKSYEGYTVAVVCAMGFEMSAVRYMLDREHPHLPTKRGDSNLYILGELSGHNVVLACLPGNQGKGSAATVATNMARTFPSIKWRFLVGIGGGVPSNEHDIRLGDVVVSMPDGQYGGVVQYDLGKDTEDSFTLKGFLWPPPGILRSAVEMMRSDHMVVQNRVDEFLSAMFQKHPRLSVYKRPSAEVDILFDPDYAHVPNHNTCDNCDKRRAVDRLPRKSDVPEIHYGLVASGDRVMRSAAKKALIGRDVGDVLCFEMEAAGLMAEFSAIVIRGISDYADSHKSDVWQHYAAAAAAGCVKELLCHLQPEESTWVPQPGLGVVSSSSNEAGVRPVLHIGSENTPIGQDANIGGRYPSADTTAEAATTTALLDEADTRIKEVRKAHIGPDDTLVALDQHIDKLAAIRTLLQRIRFQEDLQTPAVASALAIVKGVMERLVQALKGATGSFDQLTNIMDELGQAIINLRQHMPGDIAIALDNKLIGGIQTNAAMGGQRTEGRVITKAARNQAENGMQVNAPVYGDLAAFAELAKAWGGRD